MDELVLPPRTFVRDEAVPARQTIMYAVHRTLAGRELMGEPAEGATRQIDPA
jgi:hypothetical protein